MLDRMWSSSDTEANRMTWPRYSKATPKDVMPFLRRASAGIAVVFQLKSSVTQYHQSLAVASGGQHTAKSLPRSDLQGAIRLTFADSSQFPYSPTRAHRGIDSMSSHKEND